MKSPENEILKIKNFIGKSGITAFVATFVMGLLTHLSIMTKDIPNHDGLASIYSSQNVISSGRWFLSIACGISSYFSIPWLIGILSLTYLGIASIFLCKLLEADRPLVVVLISSVLATFPAIASTFAYVFTMDGYMLALLFSILSVYLVDKTRFGFVYGAVFLCLSMGIYQAYLPVAMLLCLYSALKILSSDNALRIKIKEVLRYPLMGILGASLYYIILKIVLAVNKESIGTYQRADAEAVSMLKKVKTIFSDFISFSIKGNVLCANTFAFIALAVLGGVFIISLCYAAHKKSWFKSFWFYVCAAATVILIPLITNVILFITPNATYHLLMRYQWAFLIIIMIAVINDVCVEFERQKLTDVLAWCVLISTVVISFSYAISDNIAYSNLEKKYEKTYSYCLRLADRIEQTEGYYQGIPIYMIGVVGDDNYPVTDITEKVTGHMLGMNGDYLLYTGENYEQFFENYMGISFNFLKPDEANFYYEEWYVEMPSFPAADSIRVVDGILCIKTENSDRTGTE